MQTEGKADIIKAQRPPRAYYKLETHSAGGYGLWRSTQPGGDPAKRSTAPPRAAIAVRPAVTSRTSPAP